MASNFKISIRRDNNRLYRKGIYCKKNLNLFTERGIDIAFTGENAGQIA
ncbi:MAG: hypothetical protein M1398_08245 [Deltaproteobacteria bacterium]|nr:hypothetical protein [Deltaproteobacteria bacterium]MDA8306110.1 hypothetical protein [Deltaproteobacteria bacterium]